MEFAIKKVGDFKCLESGSIVLNQSNSIVFTFSGVEIEIVFITNDGEENQSIKALPQSNKKLLIQLINFNNSLGTGITRPISIATLNSKEEVFLQYVVYSINEIKVMHYTWYSKPIINVAPVQTNAELTDKSE